MSYSVTAMRILKRFNKAEGTVLLPFLFLFCLLVVGCANKSTVRFQELGKAGGKNDYLKTIEAIKKNPKLYGEASKFLYYMDIGTLFHYAQEFDSSVTYLDEAARIYDDLFTKSITNEAASLLTNDNIRPYRSKPYEMILLHQLMMLDFMAQNNFDNALVESRRVQLLVDAWREKDTKDAKYTSDGFFYYMSALAYGKNGETDNAAISLFKSVQAYQKGIVALPECVQDLTYYTMVQNNREDDIKILNIKPIVDKERVWGIKPKETEIILVGYAGRGPVLQENAFWGTWIKDGLLVVHFKNEKGVEETLTLPAPGLSEKEYENAGKGKKTASGTTFHIKFAMPQIKTFPSRCNGFSAQVDTSKTVVKSAKVNDMDQLCNQYLIDTKTSTLFRTVLRVVIRTIAAQKTKEKVQTGNALANLALNLSTDLLADQLEKADIRTTYLIPKTVHLIRIAVSPGIHSVNARVHDASGSVVENRSFAGIEVKEGEKKVIFYPALY